MTEEMKVQQPLQPAANPLELITICPGLKLTAAHSNLDAALCKFQAEAKSPKKTGEAKGAKFSYKYVELDELLASIMPALTKNGLSISQVPMRQGSGSGVVTILRHTSGEMQISGPLFMENKDAGPQGAGSAITYSRRYSLSALLGLAWDDDDDGSRAQYGAAKAQPQAAPAAQPQQSEGEWHPNQKQANELEVMYQLCGGKNIKKLLDKYKVNSVLEMGQYTYQRVYNALAKDLKEAGYIRSMDQWIKTHKEAEQ